MQRICLGPNRMTVSSTCSPTPSRRTSSLLPTDITTNLADNKTACDGLVSETNRFDGYSNDNLPAIVPNILPMNAATKPNCNSISGNSLSPINQFQFTLNRRERGEKRPIPDEQKDEKYFERRKRNNEAAKKSRDARKIREDRVSYKLQFL